MCSYTPIIRSAPPPPILMLEGRSGGGGGCVFLPPLRPSSALCLQILQKEKAPKGPSYASSGTSPSFGGWISHTFLSSKLQNLPTASA